MKRFLIVISILMLSGSAMADPIWGLSIDTSVISGYSLYTKNERFHKWKFDSSISPVGFGLFFRSEDLNEFSLSFSFNYPFDTPFVEHQPWALKVDLEYSDVFEGDEYKALIGIKSFFQKAMNDRFASSITSRLGCALVFGIEAGNGIVRLRPYIFLGGVIGFRSSLRYGLIGGIGLKSYFVLGQ